MSGSVVDEADEQFNICVIEPLDSADSEPDGGSPPSSAHSSPMKRGPPQTFGRLSQSAVDDHDASALRVQPTCRSPASDRSSTDTESSDDAMSEDDKPPRKTYGIIGGVQAQPQLPASGVLLANLGLPQIGPMPVPEPSEDGESGDDYDAGEDRAPVTFGGIGNPDGCDGASPRPKVSKVPVSHRDEYRVLYQTQLFNHQPPTSTQPGIGTQCSSEHCAMTATVFCDMCCTAKGPGIPLCERCDRDIHSGPTVCAPMPHTRVTYNTGVALGPAQYLERIDDATLRVAPLKGVYLRCRSACPSCGGVDFSPTPGTAIPGGLCIVTAQGRFNVDRTSYTCTHCLNVIDRGDPHQYLTRSTVPATLINVEQVWCSSLVGLLHRLQVAAEDLSGTAMAAALTAATAITFPGMVHTPEVRKDCANDVLEIYEALQAVRQSAVGGLRIEHARTPDGDKRVVIVDGDFKIKLDQNRTAVEAGKPTDNLEVPGVLKDKTVIDLSAFDERDRKKAPVRRRDVNGDKREGDCSGNGDVAPVFKVIEQNDKGNLVRDGVLTAVDFTGSALSAVFLPTGWGERYIVHWILLVIAKLEADKHGGKYTTPAIDVACHFEVWRKTMDKRATVAQEALSAAWSEASANGNLVWLLEQLLDPETDNVDSFPEWYTSILTDCADRLNESELRSPAVLKADVKSMHRGLSGMLTLLEAHAGVDFAATPPDQWPILSLADLDEAALNALHAFTHGDTCRHLHNIRGPCCIGRQCGEACERYHSLLNRLRAIIASSSVQYAKKRIAALQRHERNRQVAAAARRYGAAITDSCKLVGPAFMSLLAMCADLVKIDPETTPSAEVVARERLAAAAAAVVSLTPASWYDVATLWIRTNLEDLNLIKAAHMARLRDGKSTTPSSASLRKLLRRIMVDRTSAEVVSVLQAVQDAAGADPLAANTARSALKLVATLSPPRTPDAADDLAAALKQLAFPDDIIATTQNLGGRGWRAVDDSGVVHYSAMRIGISELAILSHKIRERMVIVKSPARHFRAGGHQRGGAKNMVFTRLKSKAAELKKWIAEFNSLLDQLTTSIISWTGGPHKSISPPALVADLPEQITTANAKDPEWLPPDRGITAAARSDVGFVDALLHFRTHYDEGYTVGPARAAALLELFETHYLTLVRRLAATERVMNAETPPCRADLTVAVGNPADIAPLYRHYPRAMQTPAIFVTFDDLAAPANELVDHRHGALFHRGVLSGFRRHLEEEAALTNSRLAAARDVLDPAESESGLTPAQSRSRRKRWLARHVGVMKLPPSDAPVDDVGTEVTWADITNAHSTEDSSPSSDDE